MKIQTISTITTFLLLFAFNALASDLATTSDDRKVMLNDNGTWAYIEAEKDEYQQIDFSDFMIDSVSLDGQKVVLKATGGFTNHNNEPRPSGSVYQKTFTIGPSIRVLTDELDRANLRKVHECSLNCAMEISGTVRSKAISAMKITILDRL